MCLCVLWEGVVISRGQLGSLQTQQRWTAACHQQPVTVLFIFINCLETDQEGNQAFDLHVDRVLTKFLFSPRIVPLLSQAITSAQGDESSVLFSKYRLTAFLAELKLCSPPTPPSESWLSSDFSSHHTKTCFSKREKIEEKEESVHPSPILSLSVLLFKLQ